MPEETLTHLKKARVCGRPINIEPLKNRGAGGGQKPRRNAKGGNKGKKPQGERGQHKSGAKSGKPKRTGDRKPRMSAL